jgi:predicted metal-dependent HD superfamily phosphohydrolase
VEITIELLTETARYIELYLKTNLPQDYELRNYPATVRIVQTCDLISVHTVLEKQDRMKVILAAWFLYTGFGTDPENYQNESVKIATKYYTEKGLSTELIQEVGEIILGTRHPQQPVTIQSQILCDAENSWLAEKSFAQTLKYLRKEKALAEKKDIPERDWLAENILMFENHIYFIPFSREAFDKKKEKNKVRLQEKLIAPQNSQSESAELLTHPKKNKDKSEKLMPEDIKLERGVETLFRNISRNQIHLIRLADYKANLVISTNSIILSVILSLLVIRLDANKYLELPTLILVLTNVTTILTAISATRPKINMNERDNIHLNDAGNNLLYFGNFQKMPFIEFSQIIKETIVNKDYLYNSLSKDIYHQGIILTRKFSRINLSYNIFIIGLLLTVLTLILSFVHHMGPM